MGLYRDKDKFNTVVNLEITEAYRLLSQPAGPQARPDRSTVSPDVPQAERHPLRAGMPMKFRTMRNLGSPPASVGRKGQIRNCSEFGPPARKETHRDKLLIVGNLDERHPPARKETQRDSDTLTECLSSVTRPRVRRPRNQSAV